MNRSEDDGLETAATLYKHQGCPICEGEYDPEKARSPDRYRSTHIKIGGEYYEAKDTFGHFDEPHGELVRRQSVLDRMSEIASENWGGKHEATKQDWKNAWQTLCKELKEDFKQKNAEGDAVSD